MTLIPWYNGCWRLDPMVVRMYVGLSVHRSPSCGHRRTHQSQHLSKRSLRNRHSEAILPPVLQQPYVGGSLCSTLEKLVMATSPAGNDATMRNCPPIDSI